MAGVGDADAVAKMATYALEVDNTTTAAGVVPDFLSQEYLSIIADSRAFVNNIPQDPIGAAGMSVVYPKKTSGPSVGVQATENLEVSSTALVIGALSVDLLTYAGANRVSNQLISRSQPGFVEILLRELAGQYASVTDTASILAAVTAADGTAILADLGADAAATFAAFSVANAAIITGVRRPADTVWLASDRWAQLNSLVDGDGRPLLVFGANGPMNAQGQSQFNTMVAQYHGWIVRLDVDAADGTCLIGWSPSVANLEQAPVSLSALQVDTLSTEIGIAGLQSVVIKFDTGLYTLTAA
jgi:HK97 family phage major capsid protein